ncbi:tyrosine-type recombinase/integrase [Rhizobium lusitanum]|uniref:Site-specific recombinase XerD n=1 Tax=Rhizobium lusitanum TaxID=293958 RepID=A0A1C3VSN0_9HYPH|nr:tyrosine-type recombinase/integrase [Rhizobium lusitanum]SCB30803.1 Site-specific recombinase XerD [Rhizobium lusitanum]
MRVELKGLHKTSKKLADGTKRDYYYAWKNGPRIKAEYGTSAFYDEFRRLTKEKKSPDSNSFQSIITLYKRTDLQQRKPSTRRSYLQYIKLIEEEFGDMSIAAIEETGSRAVFLDWRSEMADRPRTADLAWSVLQKIMAFGVHTEKLKRNPCVKAGRLAETGTRREKIWLPADISKLREKASQQITDALTLALWTGQRQGDLLRLQWSSYDGMRIRLKQAKTGRHVIVLVSGELRATLERLKKLNDERKVPALTILTNSHGKTWTSDGFRTSWGKAVEAAKVSGLTFHDLRGTFITRARRAGASIEDIAEASGHSIVDVRSILETHYLAGDATAGDAVILKLEGKTS